MNHISFIVIVLLSSLWFINDSISMPLINTNKTKSNENKRMKTQDIIEKNNSYIQQCQRSLTYDEMRNLLIHSPCALNQINKTLLLNNESKSRLKRNDNPPASASHVYALQSTINDHRTIIDDHRQMINYLINNTVNITQLNQYYAEQHSKTTLHWKSWRDISLLLLMIICFCTLICFIAIRLHPLDILTSILVRRLQNKRQQQQKQKQNEIIDKKIKMNHNPKDIQAPMTQTTPISTIKQEYLRYIRASDSS